jgi:hypothetical protein
MEKAGVKITRNGDDVLAELMPVQIGGAQPAEFGVLLDGCIGLHRLEACRAKARSLAALEMPL